MNDKRQIKVRQQVDLQEIKGIGDRLSEKILKAVGGKEKLKKIVQDLDLEKITSIEGISQRKAIEIMNQLLGNPTQKFLKSERAVQLYEEIIQKMIAYSNTKYAENRILLLSPSKDKLAIEKQVMSVMKAKEKVSKLPIIKLRGLMKNLQLPVQVKPKYDPSKAILVETDEDGDYLIDIGLNQYYTIINASSSMIEEEIRGYELVYYVYSEGFLDIGEMSNLIMINKEAPEHEIVPEIILDYFNANQGLFKKVGEIRKILNEKTILEDIPPLLEEVNSLKKQDVDLEKVVNSIKETLDKEIKESIKNIDLEGDEVLDLLNNSFPPKIEKIFEEIIQKGKISIKEETGIDFDPFLKKYPLEIDEKEIERIKLMESSKKENNIFDKKVTAASQLASIKSLAEQEVKETLKFDYEFTLGSFAYEYDLMPAKIANEFKLEGALHLELGLEKGDHIQRIDYDLSYPQNVALLTGANSGGKTTLLETIGQISIMSQMGLPVCAKNAEVKLLDEIYHFSKKRSLDAGAFESFLNVFMPIVTTDSEKLVLLDELEGITELEAAVKIISSFIEMIKDSNSYAIIVTHMAKELMDYTDVRVDGIEAKGLDKNYNLIVDRTPKMNCLARSTPEFILKRIYENSDGRLKEVYGEILKKF
ncbi:endonuclease MutS2 [Methanobrevibacter cuticularis]|uniref:DNA-binding protein MutS2 n=1 Tax=Methanobrevibacter cuticularis TaxID=47311 RepID=A0A166CUE3_9EURY|nr:DNA mismatch repair protein MutS [Methanobrevibacter cuticularis]KZX16897.1 endonuclease MutS2 [Methanobrevibacter cuticularis]